MEKTKISVICSDTDDTNPAFLNIKDSIPNETILDDLSKIYKILGDQTRLKIIFALSQSELCVKHLAEIVEMEQSAVSHHLRTLRNTKLVKTKREGKNIYYTLNDHHVNALLDIGFEHVSHK